MEDGRQWILRGMFYRLQCPANYNYPAIVAHGDHHGEHIMPCSRRAAWHRLHCMAPPALHGAASLDESPGLSGVPVSACSSSQEAAAKEGSRSASSFCSLVSSYRKIDRPVYVYIK